jgi:hypothetical protein
MSARDYCGMATTAVLSKKAGTKVGPGSELVVRPDKFKVKSSRTSSGGQPRACPELAEGAAVPTGTSCYAVLRGRIVKSRNWVRTLDICIPFNCDTNGRISAMN